MGFVRAFAKVGEKHSGCDTTLMVYYCPMKEGDDKKAGRIWRKVTVSAAKNDAEAVRRAIQSQYCCGIQSEDEGEDRERLEAYFDGAAQANDLQRTIEIAAELISAAGGGQVKLEAVETIQEEDWAEKWRESWGPIRISSGLVVCPSWEEFSHKGGETVIYIYPTMAFGTGSHATTRQCLKLLEQNVSLGVNIIDIGSGSGILAIAAAKLGARRVTAVEMDDASIENAEENCRINRVKSRVKIKHMPFGPQVGGKFDLGVCNMLAHVMQPLLDDITRLLAGSRLIISGISESSAPDFKRELRQRGWKIRKTLKEGEWLGYLAVHDRK